MRFNMRSVPFLTTLARLARTRYWFQAGHRGKTALILLVLAAAIGALFSIPTDFSIQADGTLQPVVRRRLFAPEDGVVRRVVVKHAQRVAVGERLLELAKPDLALTLIKVAGDLQTARQLLQSTGAKRFLAEKDRTVTRDEKNQLAAEQERFKQQVANLQEQQKCLQRRMRGLVIHSPMRGTVLTWDVAEQLKTRPVTRGQQLLAVADLDGPWILELQIADRDVQHVLRARRDHPSALPVTYRLATHPQETYRGRVFEIAARSELLDGSHPAVRMTATIDAAAPATLRPGAEVRREES